MPDAPSNARATKHADGSRVWAALTLPGTAWLVVLFVVPFYAIAAVAFGGFDDILRRPLPEWNPLGWRFDATRAVWDMVAGGTLRPVVARTVLYVLLATALCFAIGYPVAYYVARLAGKRRNLLLGLLIVPFWMSYLMRMLAWVNLLNPQQGWAASALNAVGANHVFDWIGLSDGSEQWFAQPITVILGLVYGYVPYFVLPLYAGLDRLDTRLLEAARDLGARQHSVFWRVTLPLSLPSVGAAVVITALPMFGDYYTNTMLSGAANTEMIGNQIELMTRSSQPQRGAVLVLMLSAVLLLLMAYYTVIVARQTRSAAEARA